jgi:DNA-binding XRE family transcriptional regulator
METMVDRETIRTLRIERSWTQEQLASNAGLSLRTVQRIENDGRCSLESKKSLAATFELDAVDLDVDYDRVEKRSAKARGAKMGMGGALLGTAFAYIGISLGWAMGDADAGQVGVAYGIVGAFGGITCALIGIGSRSHESKLTK